MSVGPVSFAEDVLLLKCDLLFSLRIATVTESLSSSGKSSFKKNERKHRRRGVNIGANEHQCITNRKMRNASQETNKKVRKAQADGEPSLLMSDAHCSARK